MRFIWRPFPILALASLLFLPATVHAQLPSAHGTVYLDANDDGVNASDEALVGVHLDLYVDNGDGIFDADVDMHVASETSGTGGQFAFSSLNPSGNYFVFQGSQQWGSTQLPDRVSPLFKASGLSQVIDDFGTQQSTMAYAYVTTGASNFAGPNILGGQRDLHIQHIQGPAESVLRSNPYGIDPVLEFVQSAGNIAVATVTWDGIDSDTSTNPMAGGLGGIDLTAAGATGFALNLGIDAAGAGEALRVTIFSGSATSIAEIFLPITGGNASIFQIIPFSSLVGDASVADVDAIQLQIGGLKPSIDARIADFGLYAPKLVDIVNPKLSGSPVPEPSALGLALFGSLGLLRLRRRSR